MYTKQHILEIAMKQSTADNHCTMEDFLKPDHVMVDFALGEQARKYYSNCNSKLQ